MKQLWAAAPLSAAGTAGCISVTAAAAAAAASSYGGGWRDSVLVVLGIDPLPQQRPRRAAPSCCGGC